MFMPPKPNPYGIRTVNPSVWPQFPYNEAPHTPEQSEPRYEVQNDWNQAVAVRDGTRLLLDVYRPRMPGEKFPALCSFSPYTRQLQRDSPPIGQNEAGISEFWVPRGYAHVIVDVRGANGSEGNWDMWGPEEQKDLADIIEWVAEQPWCNGNVGMMGCSYFAMTQNLAAEQQPPSLKAIFPYDAGTDLYRDFFFNGGIPQDGFTRIWFSDVEFLNFWGGRNTNTAAMTRHFETVLGQKYPFDGPYYQERSAWPNLNKIRIPAYFGCHWSFYNHHLRGSFRAWQGTGDITKRMIIGPNPVPPRPYANYHKEALRWYDHFLKGMDTRVLEGAPIHLWIGGEGVWRDEREWPLARTQWKRFYLGGAVENGTLADTPPLEGGQTLSCDPASEQWIWGQPRWVYRSEMLDRPLEITGPIQLNLVMASTAEDTDWIAILQDEAPDGSIQELTRGWLRSSHRATDAAKSGINQPWHPHDKREMLTPNRPEELVIEIIPTSNLFLQGHRIRLELANCDSLVQNSGWYRRTLPLAARNTVLQGRGKSYIVMPLIPR
jgi:predicted acyl esterase